MIEDELMWTRDDLMWVLGQISGVIIGIFVGVDYGLGVGFAVAYALMLLVDIRHKRT